MVKKIHGCGTVSSDVCGAEKHSRRFGKAAKIFMLAFFASACAGCFTGKELSPNDDEMQPPENGATLPHVIPAPAPRY